MEHIRLRSPQRIPPSRDVVIMRAGQANGYRFTGELLAQREHLFEGVPVFIDHARSPRSVRDLVGAIEGARFDPRGDELRARLNLMPSASWVARLIAEMGDRPQVLGLSADMYIEQLDHSVTDIHKVVSVDIVAYPAAGGRFMTQDAEGLPSAASASPAGDEHPSERRESHSMEQSVNEERGQRVRLTGGPPPDAEGGAAAPRNDEQAQEIRRQLIELQLGRSELPQPLRDQVRAQCASQPMNGEAVAEMIARLEGAWAKANESLTVRNLGRVEGLVEPIDRVTLAFEQLLGVGDSKAHRKAPRLSGIRELYDLLTGDWERRGLFRRDRVTLANVTTSTMTSVVANALNKVLVQAYNMRPQWWKRIVWEEDFASMQQAKWIALGGFADLSTVSEGGSYTELSWSDNEETSDFEKHGNYVGLTLEMIDRDDVGAVRAIPRKLGLAAARTLAADVAAVFTDNSGTGPTLSDSNNLFDASNHGNLLTTALGADAWDAVIQAMFKQTEATSGKRLGVRPRYCLVPIDLEKTALTIFASDREPGQSNWDANVRRMSDAVVTVPEWTDVTDWAAAADPQELQGVCVGYRFGRTPEIYVADSGVVGSMFTNDEMRIKVRFVYTVGIGDYRALHKNNVAD